MWAQPDVRCEDTQEHMFHEWSVIDEHFKEIEYWCPGICSCGHSTPENTHGPGGHK